MKDKLSAHQETISILSKQKEAQIKLYKTREDKELDKVIELENKVKVLDNIVYKSGQSVQTMNMLNNKCRTSFAKPEFLNKAQRANPRLYDIGTVNSWNLFKKDFIQRYCPPSKTAKQLEEICNFKQEGDETLYQAWEQYNDLLYKFPLMTLIAIRRSSSKNIEGSSNSEGITAIVRKLDNLGRDMKKLKENVHAIQAGYLSASVNVIPKTMFEHLKLAQLKKTNMPVKMAYMTKRYPIEIVENDLVKIDRFLFPSDFVVMDMLNRRSRYKGVEFEVSSTRFHVVARGNEVVQWTLCKNLSLAIINRRGEQRSGESFVLILLLFHNFISLNVQ
uniref:Retrotransposon gag domain-containing protein n=1 Tax=Tanacetum cinerariifolium TaxID=118510 RepID=A0A6L2NTP5_TANCI|nr:hypothetical protein [Tanacetum cinerariifolium]